MQTELFITQAIHDGGCFRREGRHEAMASRLNYYGFAALRHGSHVGVQRVENLKISPGPDRYDPGTLWVKRFGLASPRGLGRAAGRFEKDRIHSVDSVCTRVNDLTLTNYDTLGRMRFNVDSTNGYEVI